MQEQETLSKKEYEFLNTIDKQNALIEKLKIAHENEKKIGDKLKSEKESLSNESISLKNELSNIRAENDTSIIEAQKYITKVEAIYESLIYEVDDLKNIIEQQENVILDFKKNMLSEDELHFYKGCKADVVLHKLAEQNKLTVSLDELKNLGFPAEYLEKDQAGIRTSNFMLQKTNGHQYKLTKP